MVAKNITRPERRSEWCLVFSVICRNVLVFAVKLANFFNIYCFRRK